MTGTPKGTNLHDKTDHPEAGVYDAGLTDYIWSDDYNDLAITVNGLFSGVFTEGIEVTGDSTFVDDVKITESWASPATNILSALQLVGSYGGGITFSDGGYGGIWVASAGAEMHFNTGGTGSGFGSTLGSFRISTSRILSTLNHDFSLGIDVTGTITQNNSTFTQTGASGLVIIDSGHRLSVDRDGVGYFNNRNAGASARMYLGVGSTTVADMIFAPSEITSVIDHNFTANITLTTASAYISGASVDSRKEVIFGDGTLGARFVVNDIAGAKYAVETGSYNLTFKKHDADAGAYVTALTITGVNANDGNPIVDLTNSRLSIAGSLGSAGQHLETDGTNVSWQTPSGGGSSTDDIQLVKANGSQIRMGTQNASTTSGMGIMIENTAEASGEASGRLFFNENNTGLSWLYGLSWYYQGDSTVSMPSGFVPSTGNATWGLFRHNNSVNGVYIMKGARTNSDVAFGGNITVVGNVDGHDIDAEIDKLNLNGITSYVQNVNVGDTWGAGGTQVQDESVGNSGMIIGGTGAQWVWFHISPPEWLVRYCAENSKLLRVTTISCKWQNARTNSYITRVIVYKMDYDANTNTGIYDNSANLGSGSTGFRTDIFNVTDTTLALGDWVIARIQTQQDASFGVFIRSFLVSWTLV